MYGVAGAPRSLQRAPLGRGPGRAPPTPPTPWPCLAAVPEAAASTPPPKASGKRKVKQRAGTQCQSPAHPAGARQLWAVASRDQLLSPARLQTAGYIATAEHLARLSPESRICRPCALLLQANKTRWSAILHKVKGSLRWASLPTLTPPPPQFPTRVVAWRPAGALPARNRTAGAG